MLNFLQTDDTENGLVCCCPPNLSRTLGMIGGYTWSAKVADAEKVIHLDVYLFISVTRKIALPGGGEATVKMETEMPWEGKTKWTFDAPEGWKWAVRLPKPHYAENIGVSDVEVFPAGSTDIGTGV
jgi:DUF1680 family protein